ncbi:hypothetical protein VO64_1913 [Pseudomonas synxantha]|uniref:Threonine synthase n=1 Tax=Pseudomonas synxantha TaxID=47883 RepID=A0AAU8TJH0_9PSED|nr:hypothetical protein VO64_1913 [Pseudomonas synxantha]
MLPVLHGGVPSINCVLALRASSGAYPRWRWIRRPDTQAG